MNTVDDARYRLTLAEGQLGDAEKDCGSTAVYQLILGSRADILRLPDLTRESMS